MECNKHKLLIELGRIIEKYGEQTPKRHGSEWNLLLKSGIRFWHDDYNHAVKAFYPDGSSFYYGMDFGDQGKNEAMLNVSINNFISTIELIKYEKEK